MRFGRIGTNGQEQVKDLDTNVVAAEHLDTLVAAKGRLAELVVAVTPGGVEAWVDAEVRLLVTLDVC